MRNKYVWKRSEGPSNNTQKDDQSHNNNNDNNNNGTSRWYTYLSYMECERNVAERIGGHAYDGCREFIASGPEGTTEALICAACNCARNFHRLIIRTEFVHINKPPSARAPLPPPPPPPAAPGAPGSTTA